MITDEEWQKRKQVRVPLPIEPEVAAVFAAWKQAYETVVTEGEEKGWLGYDYDGGAYVRDPSPPGYSTREETDEEYEARVNSSLARMNAELLETYRRASAQMLEKRSVSLSHLLSAIEPDENGEYVTFPIVTKRPEAKDE